MDVYNELLCKLNSKKIRVEHKDKIIKRGTLINWKCNPFFMELTIKTEKKEDSLKLFYPFDYEDYYDVDMITSLYLDYRLSTFNHIMNMNMTKADVENFGYHKFLDTIVNIEVE